MPRVVGEKVEEGTCALSIARSRTRTSSAEEDQEVAASILLISGCMDNQFSMDGERNGALAGTLKRVWGGGKFTGHYRKFRDKIVSLMPTTQTPNYYFVGAPDLKFEGQKPFEI